MQLSVESGDLSGGTEVGGDLSGIEVGVWENRGPTDKIIEVRMVTVKITEMAQFQCLFITGMAYHYR